MIYKNYDDVRSVESYDFFSEDETIFYQKHFEDSVVVRDGKKEKIPLVSIVIPTCGRPTLKLALDSALNQIGFDDYEVVVVDNEGVDIGIETETSKYISSIKSDKIIYYRYIKPVPSYRADSALSYARTKWIMFLHDDDFLSPYILYILTSIIKNNPEIKWLSSNEVAFLDEDETINVVNSEIIENDKMKAFSCSDLYYVLDGEPGWLGALIDRESYIQTGGMPAINTDLGDTIMQQKFATRHFMYKCDTKMHLYNYRISAMQASNNKGDGLINRWISECIFWKIAIKKYFPKMWKVWFFYKWKSLFFYYQSLFETYHLEFDYSKVVELLGIPFNWTKNTKISNLIIVVLSKYKNVYKKEQWIESCVIQK